MCASNKIGMHGCILTSTTIGAALLKGVGSATGEGSAAGAGSASRAGATTGVTEPKYRFLISSTISGFVYER